MLMYPAVRFSYTLHEVCRTLPMKAMPQAEDELERKEWMESLQAVIAVHDQLGRRPSSHRATARRRASQPRRRTCGDRRTPGPSPLGMAGLNLDSADGSPSPASSVVSDESHAEVSIGFDTTCLGRTIHDWWACCGSTSGTPANDALARRDIRRTSAHCCAAWQRPH